MGLAQGIHGVERVLLRATLVKGLIHSHCEYLQIVSVFLAASKEEIRRRIQKIRIII